MSVDPTPASTGNNDPQPGWPARFGRRNLAYLGFVLLLIPLGLAMEEAGPKGPDSGGGIMFAIILWAIVSIGFFAVNAVLSIVAFAKAKPIGKPLIACALPMLIAILVMASDALVPY
jgi:hypothetical protein